MKDKEIYNQFVKIELPHFKHLLEKGITKDENLNLDTENYIRLFLKNYLENNSFRYFTEDLILSEDLFFAFYLNKFECKIIFQLSLDLNYRKSLRFLDEDYQIKMTLNYNLSNENRESSTAKISRNNEGFYSGCSENADFHIFENNIFKILKSRQLINTKPDTVKFEYNIDY
ncbi:hypothetical protein ASG31_07305 [Chryseobacterium sp. Leaf404]|uniref:hypothetical protein n=1 Tax=unclassified Chryseobacterium TaxID=2593645 RepID=UPI0006F76A05|nr:MULTISPECIES: hypothetical protein [unclassified Chryseobacterium]KQT18516.1 hypothetical protein ASG31_07305 [Chryseobacterium sp. Leaf404]